MKKIGLFILIVFLMFIPVALSDPVYVLIDSYSEGNATGVGQINVLHPSAGGPSAMGQSFVMGGVDHPIGSAIFYMTRFSGATGTVRVGLYAHTGTFGTTGTPTGAALAYSDSVDLATIPGVATLVTFNFTGVNQVNMVAGTHYFIVVERNALSVAGATSIWVDTASSAAGNGVGYASSAWEATAFDRIFYVYYIENAPNVLSVDSTSLLNKDSSGWINATIRDLEGYADLKTVDIQINTTGDVESFTLRWTQSSGVFSEVSDTSNICTLGLTSVRTNLNSTTDKISFDFTMTGGTDGDCDVKVTATDDGDLTGSSVFSNEFEYATYAWTDLYWLMNSAADLFGVSAWVTKVTVFFTAIFVLITQSLIDMVTMIVQIFVVINGVFSFTMNWFTRMVSLLVSVFTNVRDIINGTTSAISGLTNLWTLINVDEWVDFIPVAILISWMESLDKRGKVQGHNTVLMGDLSTAFNLLSFFMTWIGYVVGMGLTAVDLFVGLIQRV